MKGKLRESMGNKLTFITFSRNCNCMLPRKRDIYNEFFFCDTMHLCSFKFLAFFNIAMKSSLCMAFDS